MVTSSSNFNNFSLCLRSSGFGAFVGGEVDFGAAAAEAPVELLDAAVEDCDGTKDDDDAAAAILVTLINIAP